MLCRTGLFTALRVFTPETIKVWVIRAFRNYEVGWRPYGCWTKQDIRVRGQLFAWQEVCAADRSRSTGRGAAM